MLVLQSCTCTPSIGRITRIGFLLSWLILVGFMNYVVIYIFRPVMSIPLITLFLYLLHGLYTTITESPFLLETSTTHKFLGSKIGALLSLFIFVVWIYILGAVFLLSLWMWALSVDGRTPSLGVDLFLLAASVDLFGLVGYLIYGIYKAWKQLMVGNRDRGIKLDTLEERNDNVDGHKLFFDDTAV